MWEKLYYQRNEELETEAAENVPLLWQEMKKETMDPSIDEL